MSTLGSGREAGSVAHTRKMQCSDGDGDSTLNDDVESGCFLRNVHYRCVAVVLGWWYEGTGAGMCFRACAELSESDNNA